MPKRVHVIDGAFQNRARVSRTFSDLGISNEIYENMEELLERVPTDGIILASDDEHPRACENIMRSLQSAGSCLPVVMYSEKSRPEQIVNAMLSGALDYLVYPFSLAAISGAFDKLESEDFLRVSRTRKTAAALNQIKRLSKRELEILRCVVQGHSSKGIAKHLDISPRTVEVHRSKMLAKLSARSTAEAVRIAIYAGID